MSEMASSLFESILFIIFLTLFLKPKQDKKVLYLGAFLSVGLLFLNIFVSDYFSIFNAFTILIDLIITGIFWRLCLKGSLRQFIMGFALYYFGLYFRTYIVYYGFLLIDSNLFAVLDADHSIYRIIYITLAQILLLVYTIIILCNRTKFFYNKNKVMFLCYLVLPVISLAIFTALTSSLASLYFIEPELGIRITGVMVGLLLMLALIIYLSVNAARKQEKEWEAKNLHSMISIQEESIERFITQERELHKLKHELEHKLYSVRYLLEQNKIEESMESFRQIITELCGESIDMTVSQNIVDTIISNKELKYYARDILIEKDIKFVNDEIMELVDLCILIGNLLDNAIEAADKSESKKVKITVREEYGCLLIYVANTYSQKYSDVHDFLSHKDEIRKHGFGMRSIKEIVGKYNGDFWTETEGDWLYANVVIHNQK